MARKNSKHGKQQTNPDLVAVDIYYLPAEQAEMYQVLREAIASETLDWLKQLPAITAHYRQSDEEEGEAILAMSDEQEVFRFYLNPQNISAAQKARDKDQLGKYLEKYLQN